MIKFSTLFLILLISLNSYTQKKTKKIKEPQPALSLQEKANKEVNTPVKINTAKNNENVGVLVVTPNPIASTVNIKSFPVGVSISTANLSGTLKNQKNSMLNLRELTKPYLFRLDFYYTNASWYLNNLGFHVGFQQSRENLNSTEDVLINQNLIMISFSKIFSNTKIGDFFYTGEVGIHQLQASNSENSLLNLSEKFNFAGIGFENSYLFNESYKLQSALTYRQVILGNPRANLDPVTLSIGATYLW